MPCAAVKQARAQGIFQRLDQRAERGLRQMALHGRAGKAAVLGQRHKRIELAGGKGGVFIHLICRWIDCNNRFHRIAQPAYIAPQETATDVTTHTPPAHWLRGGLSGDRTDAAAPVVQALIASGQPAVLIFETLAERTLALAQLARRTQPDAGYEPLLVDLLQPVLADCLAHGVRIVSNFGAANPAGAARRIHQLAAALGLRAPRIAVVQGDDLSGPITGRCWSVPWAPPCPPSPSSAPTPTSARRPLPMLRAGADIVVCGRVADPSLVLGPAMAHYGWAADDWNRLARATMAGHLLECGAQVTGGYFADPGYKDVPGLATLGYPIAEIDPDGHCTITKPAGTGGCINERTVKEQLLYELHDPAAYLTPMWWPTSPPPGAARGARCGAAGRRARPPAAAHAQGECVL